MIQEQRNRQEVTYTLWQGIVISTDCNHVQDVPNIQQRGLVIFYNDNQIEIVAEENIATRLSDKKSWWNKCVIATATTSRNLDFEAYSRIAQCFSQYINTDQYNISAMTTDVKELTFEEEQYLRALVRALSDLRIDLHQYKVTKEKLKSRTLYTYTATNGCHADIYEEGGYIVFLKGARLSPITEYTPPALNKQQIVLAYQKIQPFIQNGILTQDYRATMNKSVALSLVTGNVITGSRWKTVEVE